MSIQERLFTHTHTPLPPLLSVDPNDQKKTACYDIDVEVEDPLKGQMSSFLLSTANQQEIASLDNKVRPPRLVIDPGVPFDTVRHTLVLSRLSCVKSQLPAHSLLKLLSLQQLT